jgi:hypothetical protein
MRPLSAITMLDVWDRARGVSVPRRALALLDAASPETPYHELAALPVGERDARLLALREWAFGADMRALANCPECNEAVEIALRADQMRAGETHGSGFEIEIDGRMIAARAPSAGDLVELEDVRDAACAERVLLERCIGRSADDLPEGVAESISRRMAECDPRANIELALECPACGRAWVALFDVVSFFWREIEAWARRVLGQVHTLASAYGWTEREILALSPSRRECYLRMVSE